ncbi:MAG: bifunctional pyr operon transcriptional regulator/uracil phosphoribosyltransferase PyrR [Acidiferrobacterales bacterium]
MNNQIDINATLANMATALKPKLDLDPVFIGIHTGGAWIAERLHRDLDIKPALGTLNISFYRDDFTRIGLNPKVKASDLPVDVEDRHIILIDDVLQSGRTIRAAMNEIFDYGRPASITLVVLIERGSRELPIRADIVGETITLPKGEQIKLSRDEKTRQLALTIQKSDDNTNIT